MNLISCKMNPAISVIPTAPMFTLSQISDRLEELHYLYERLGSELDLFTTRETDSEALFDLADELEIGLIVLLSALRHDLGSTLRSGRGNPNDVKVAAERLHEAARWLYPIASRITQGTSHLRLGSLVEQFASESQDLASLLFWHWLAGCPGEDLTHNVRSLPEWQDHRLPHQGQAPAFTS